MSSYREQFFEWVNKQPVYQDMTLQTKAMTLNLVDCWLNNVQAYVHYTRLSGKDFTKKCAVDFCWFIKNQTIADLQHKLKVAEKALELACKYFNAVEGDELYELCKNIYNDNDYLMTKMNHFKEQAKKELEGE